MERTIASHDSLLGDLAGLDPWLSKMGVPARSSDRIHQLIRLLDELKPPSFGSAMRITREQQRQYMYALGELVEFHQIFLALKGEHPKILRPKLVHCLSGSLDPADETVRNNVARNTIFELALASEWRTAGVRVQIGDPDLRLTLGAQEFLVECKRPFDWTGVVRCLKNAKGQLSKSGARAEVGSPKGVIAISLSKIVARGQSILLGRFYGR